MILTVFRVAMLGLLLTLSASAYGIDNEFWGFCKDGKAFSDAAMTLPKAESDWVCALPTGAETGIHVETSTARCLLDQRENCEFGAGGSGARGDHNVPRAAWYWLAGLTADQPDVRCECGCFTGDVKVLTHLGPMRLDEASTKASSLGGISMAVQRDERGGYKGSARLTNKNFVVGPEEKPIVHIATVSGQNLTMTDGHPVLVLRKGNWQMVRAEELVFGDTVMSAEGTEDKVSEITSHLLPESDRLVYNFDTQGKSDYEHIIFANGLRVGDLHWQKRLSEENSRSENLLKFAHQ
ncbi:MAG: Hint domain-containing protein [Pseudobdellovibrionaceae bacterium]|nr:Hint domain-containing protein [Pseudobdellovibrionaceae bacterium]